MFDHIGLRVKDLDAAAVLHAAMPKPLGCVPVAKGQGYAGFGPKDKPLLTLHADATASGSHAALRPLDRSAADRYFGKGWQAGAKDSCKPGFRADCAPDCGAAFLADLDGHDGEAACMK